MTMKTVLITGAAKRIGANIARGLHANGMNVIIHYHSSEKEARCLTDELNSIRLNSACLVRADLRKIESINGLLQSVLNFTESLDVLINNASMFYPTTVGETTADQWMDLVGTNLKAPYFLAQTFQAMLKTARGCIINITDVYGDFPLKNHAVYSASKAGLIMLTKSLAQELAPDIRVNAVSPGAILWPDSIEKNHQSEVIAKTLLGRTGSGEDITRAIRFLIESDFITAQIVNVDGGRLN
jgi:pteridine reductase